jgi:predicted RNase H-like nuclease (RuvC/YqgF family)
MKKIASLVLFVSVIALLSTGCTKKYKDEIVRLNAVADSLKNVGAEKDNVTMSYVSGFNSIQSNLDLIKQKEKIISEQSSGSMEERKSYETQINNDIAAINDLLQKNKALVENLRGQLKSMGKKNSEKTAELQKMIDNLTAVIAEKDAEIVVLKEELSKKNIQITTLETNLVQADEVNKAKTATIEEQVIEKNTVYYIIGTRKALEEKKIITKDGGFVGIGKTRKVSGDFDKSLFTQVDLRELKSLPVFSKKPKLLSVHPTGSYEFIGAKTIDSLKILHTDDFWSASKYLVLMID